MSPFDFVSAICDTKQDILENEKDYNAFIILRALSYHVDTVLYANEMNIYPNLPARLQFDYLRFSIRARKRFAKWAKPEADENIDLIMEYMDYSRLKAEQILPILTKEQLSAMKKRLQKGGC